MPLSIVKTATPDLLSIKNASRGDEISFVVKRIADIHHSNYNLIKNESLILYFVSRISGFYSINNILILRTYCDNSSSFTIIVNLS